jgi:high-affinity iron transporter
MWESAFLVLREAAELIFIALSACAYLRRIGRGDLLSHLTHGWVGGGVVAAAVVVLLSLNECDDRVEAALSIGLGLSVLFMAIAMLSSRNAIDEHVRGRMEDYLEGRAGVRTVVALGAFASFRETFETGVFLHAFIVENGLGPALAGTALGVALTGLMAVSYRSLQSRISLFALFRISTLVLSLIAIQLILEGIGALMIIYARGPSDTLQLAAESLTPGQPSYFYVCLALMLGPLYLVVRHWWHETSAR